MHSIEKKIYLGLLVCFLTSMIGVSFAYFTGGVRTTGTGGRASASTADLIYVEYNAGDSSFSLPDAIPGASASKTFSVSVNPTEMQKSATYGIYLNISTNSFVKCSDSNYNATTNACVKDAEELVYTLKDETGATIATGDLLEKTGKIELKKITKTITTDATYRYTFQVTFKNVDGDQNHNKNKSLTGNISVSFAE